MNTYLKFTFFYGKIFYYMSWLTNAHLFISHTHSFFAIFFCVRNKTMKSLSLTRTKPIIKHKMYSYFDCLHLLNFCLRSLGKISVNFVANYSNKSTHFSLLCQVSISSPCCLSQLVPYPSIHPSIHSSHLSTQKICCPNNVADKTLPLP